MQFHIQRRTALLERRRALRLALRLTRSKLELYGRRAWQSTIFAFWCTIFTLPAYTNPEGGHIVAGEGAISQVDTSTLAIHQASDKLIINWDDFSIAADEATHFYQPGADAVALNRILGQDPSLILGQLSADGKLVLINPNGILFGEGSRIDVGALIATTHDIDNDDFLRGNYVFDQSGAANASIVNEGTITAANQGLVAFVAPSVRNSGLISAKLGTVELGAASKFTLDFYGDDLISFPIDAEVPGTVLGPDGEPVGALVDMDGTIEGETVILSARAAREVVNNVISTGGTIKATSAHQRGGRIILDGGTSGTVSVTGTLDASGIAGGAIDIIGERVLADGTINATGENEVVADRQIRFEKALIDNTELGSGSIETSSLEVIEPGGSGGDISIDGEAWVSVGGDIDASGRSGGTVSIEAGGLSIAGIIEAAGEAEAGGTIDIHSSGKAWVYSSGGINASGASGGSITQTSDQQITGSGTYIALGYQGDGGQIDMTAPVTKLLSPTLATSGLTSGGQIRIGGEYQGGKNLEIDELANAQMLVATDGTRIYANTTGTSGDGGEVIVWSDNETIFLGSIEALPGSKTGEGGFVEVSSGDILNFGGEIATGYVGREGTVLLDPKDLKIVEDGFSQIQLILGFNYEDTLSELLGTDPGGNDRFGSAVSLDGTRLAVGANLADGLGNPSGRSGEVHLFSFSDTAFNGGRLEGSIGIGYTGSNSLNMAGILGSDDYFGYSVSLDGTRLAVGAYLDDGSGNTLDGSGAVYLFSFSDTAFNGGLLEATIGHGYVGGKNVDMTGTLEISDNFGWSVSLDGTRLAVGSYGDDGFGNGSNNSGAVRLFTFSDTTFTGGVHVATIGNGYVGGKNVDLTGTLGSTDRLGFSLSLSGNALAVGASQDDGVSGNGLGNSGAVHLFSFTDSVFTGGLLEATIGHGYSGGKNVDIAGLLSSNDRLGSSVSLDGTALAVGASRDDGFGNVLFDTGAVHLFSFSDTTFSGGVHEATIGYGYSGGKNIDLTGTLDSTDRFGNSVSLDGTRLAVGVEQDDGSGNSQNNSGSVHLFSFTDTVFSGGTLEATVGSYYNLGKDIDTTATIGQSDYFGWSVSLDGTRLAVGAYQADGNGNALNNSGVVHLFTFSDMAFSGGNLEATIGHGYTGGKNIDLTGTLNTTDYFGSSVSLDSTRLAVGAYRDDGSGNLLADSGAVYLFSFSDMTFSGGNLEATIGQGYVGGKDIDLSGTLEGSDNFGYSVSLDGTRLAVGAHQDDGDSNSRSNSGAVYLFSFSDTSFSGGVHEATMGYGYSGGKNIDLSATLGGDRFGGAVSLDGNALAVGASQDDGSGNSLGSSGAVHLFSFSDAAFNGVLLEGTIGHNYAGGKNINLSGSLGNSDFFGWSVSLNGTRLAVGAYRDDGNGNTLADSGAVYLFSFSDTSFSGGFHEATVGHGYSGGKNLDLTGSLGLDDRFGSSVSLEGTRIAAGAYQNDGINDTQDDSGAVFLLRREIPIGVADATWTGGTSASSDSVMTISTLTALLDGGNNVTLQANNDLTLATDLIVNNGGGDGGNLVMQAGRSVLLNGDIFTDNGDLTVIANELLSAGVVDSERDAGAAVITMATGTSIDAGSGAVHFSLLDGNGKTNTTSGDVSLRAISGGTVIVQNLGGTGDVVLDGTITASGNLGDGNSTAIVLASSAGNFINNAGASALNPGAGRFIVYSQNPGSDTQGGLTATSWYNTVFNSGDPTGVAGTGDRFAFNQTATLSVTANDTSRDYGDANPVFTGGAVTGYVNGETIAILTGGPGFTTAATISSGIGSYAITEDGSLATDRNYSISTTDGTLTIDPATLTVTVDDKSRDYGDANPALTGVITGLKVSDTSAVVSGLVYNTAATISSIVGDYDIIASGASAANYVFSYVDGTLTIDPATLTVTADDKSREYAEANPALTGVITGFKLSDTAAIVSGVSYATSAVESSDVGGYAITGSGAVVASSNYVVAYVDGTLSVDPAPLTVTANDVSKNAGEVNPAFSGVVTGFKLGQDDSVLSGLTYGSVANIAFPAGSYPITSSGGTAVNYVITTRIDGVLTIDGAPASFQILGELGQDFEEDSSDNSDDSETDGCTFELPDQECSG